MTHAGQVALESHSRTRYCESKGCKMPRPLVCKVTELRGVSRAEISDAIRRKFRVDYA